ncbi:hypothetical protein FISHEDRAFT_46802, partial [Fistulina hepatica ATCC 64428]
LKDHGFQEDYRKFVQGKVCVFGSPIRVLVSTVGKLREGVYASRRVDSFTLEVYETSLALAVISGSSRQIDPILSNLIPELYLKIPAASPPMLLLLVALLYTLMAAYPSQRAYHDLLQKIPDSVFPRRSPAYHWIQNLSSCLRSQNYARLATLTRPDALAALGVASTREDLVQAFESLSLDTPGTASSLSIEQLSNEALLGLLDKLRAKVRQAAWAVVRSAYREISCRVDLDTWRWLSRSLFLSSDADAVMKRSVVLQWLEDHAKMSEVQRKEDGAERWIVYKTGRV